MRPPRRPASSATLSLLALLTCGGCVVVPWASPPGRIATSVSAQRLHRHGANEIAPTRAGGELRIGVHPLQAWQRFAARPVDFGAGFVGRLDGFEGGDGMQAGGYLELGLYPWSRRLDGGRLRMGLISQLELFPDEPDPSAIPGWGLSTGILMEWTQLLVDGEPVEGASEEGAFFGLGWGEVGFGLELGSSYQNSWDGERWMLRAGLSVRLPALAGLAVVPIHD